MATAVLPVDGTRKGWQKRIPADAQYVVIDVPAGAHAGTLAEFLDIADAVPKDDMASMEHPLFSLATKPDMRHLLYESGDSRLEITPSYNGLPTIFDKDILIFCISQLMHLKNRGEQIGKRVRFTGRELLVATNRPTNTSTDLYVIVTIISTSVATGIGILFFLI